MKKEEYLDYYDYEPYYIVEASSKILKDRKEDIDSIYNINQILKEAGLDVDENCGGHIHIGADYLSSKESLQRLLELFCNCEEIFYIISNEKGSTMRLSYDDYASAVSGLFREYNIDEDNDTTIDKFIRDIKRIQGTRSTSINFLNLGTSKNTIEFRMPNGTLDPDVWIDNIRLFGRLVQVSEELGKIDRKKEEEMSIEDREEMYLATMLSKKDVKKEDRARILINLLFKEEKYKKIYLERYLENSKYFHAEENNFGMIDFKNLYRETQLDFYEKYIKGGRKIEKRDDDCFDRS